MNATCTSTGWRGWRVNDPLGEMISISAGSVDCRSSIEIGSAEMLVAVKIESRRFPTRTFPKSIWNMFFAGPYSIGSVEFTPVRGMRRTESGVPSK